MNGFLMTLNQALTTNRVLPPNVSAEDADAAFAEFIELLGQKWVISDPEKVSEYGDRFPVGDAERFQEKLKDSLDPNGIIAPGKSGIWGARYRGQNL